MITLFDAPQRREDERRSPDDLNGPDI